MSRSLDCPVPSIAASTGGITASEAVSVVSACWRFRSGPVAGRAPMSCAVPASRILQDLSGMALVFLSRPAGGPPRLAGWTAGREAEWLARRHLAWFGCRHAAGQPQEKGLLVLLENKNAIVYGAAGAIGAAVARAYAGEGARLFLAGRTLETLEEVAADIRARGGTATTARVDAMDKAAVDTHADQVATAAGSIDISFNAVAV